MMLKICLIIVQISFVCSNSNTNNINDFILDLKYNPNEILSYVGDRVYPIPTNGTLNKKGNFVVLEHKKIKLEKARSDVEVLTSNMDRAFPGSLLLANLRLNDNNPDILELPRAPLQYTFNLPGLTEDEGTFTTIPSYDDYKLQHDSKLRMWFDKYYQSHIITPLSVNEHALAYTMKQMAIDLGMDFILTNVAANIDFDSINKAKKTVMIHKLKQIFYNVTVESPTKPSDVFDTTVTLEQVKGKVNDENPPVLVDTVSYGKVIYVKTETNSVDKESKLFMLDKIKSFDVSNKTDIEVQKRLKNLNFKVFIMGGGSKHVQVIGHLKTMKEVQSIISQYSTLTPHNSGYPLSYSIKFLKDNSRATINGKTEYNDVSKNVYKKGTIEIDHSGDYDVSFMISWNKISYDKNGEMQVERKEWSENGKSFSPKFETQIELTGQHRNISISVRFSNGLSMESWPTLVNCSGFNLVSYRSFQFMGTAQNPQFKISPPIKNCL